ncbi:MAG TPA: chorismate pyruvate-lyase family protein [Rhizomicrobium sp.]|nr:chorismate pyruvate-lyase family protein [Rhizomicrobium sp.]
MNSKRTSPPRNSDRSIVSALAVLESVAGLDAARLSPLQRILLITDGTLTEILEAHFLEPIELVKLSQRIFVCVPGMCGTGFAEPGESVLERRINLRGARSRRLYVYAESLLLVDRLDRQFRTELMDSEIPLGRLWHKFRLETYKHLVGVECRRGGDLAFQLACPGESRVLARTYEVISSGKRLMRISEYFCTDGPLA